ncbi:putative E3 ubiquitin-protein ligase XBAT31 isoform X2 [Apium graveolens]
MAWPSPLKFNSELNQVAKILLEKALMEINREREKSILKGVAYSLPSPSQSDSGTDDDISEISDVGLCCICFDQVCTIELQDCGHQMCAHYTLALCCHNKPNPTTACLTSPVYPFCQSTIVQLVVIQVKVDKTTDSKELASSNPRKSKRFRKYSEGSSSFKYLSAVSSFGRMGTRGSGRIATENEWVDKP